MSMKEIGMKLLKFISTPVVSNLPLSKWGYWLGRIHEIKLYGKVKKQNPIPLASGSANINIIIDLLNSVKNVDGDIAECGVFRGSSITSIAYYVKSNNISKQVYGFDSFEGFSQEELKKENSIHNSDEISREAQLFQNNSINLVNEKLKLVNVSNHVILVKGFFIETLPMYSSHKFSFVHLDCDLYEPYRHCLEFFYFRISSGGIILFDEYNDAVYKDCNKAVDEFLSDKPEELLMIENSNQIKYYLVKL